MGYPKFKATYNVNGEEYSITPKQAPSKYYAKKEAIYRMIGDELVPDEDILLLRVAQEDFGVYSLDELSEREYEDCEDSLIHDFELLVGEDYDDADNPPVKVTIKIEEIKE